MLIPVRIPFVTTNLTIKLYDKDEANDEICGSLFFSFNELLESKSGSLFWVNVYGPQGGDEQGIGAVLSTLSSKPKEYEEMCHNPSLANSWKCRILIGIEHYDSDSPKFMIKPIEDEELKKRAKILMEPQTF